MPVLLENEVLDLLRDGTITALSVDTNIFYAKDFRLSSPPLATVARLKDRSFPFILSGTVAREIRDHIEDRAVEALGAARKTIGTALRAFETEQPTRDDILALITGGQTPEAATQSRLDRYIAESGCEVLKDETLVATKDLFDAYFGKSPPFSAGKKKSEFPDALALHALEATARARGTGILLVSNDGDWVSFCEGSQHLYLVRKIETALSLLSDPPLVLRQSLLAWLGPKGEGRSELRSALEKEVLDLDVDVNGQSTSGEMEADVYGTNLDEVHWPDEADVDIIEASEPDEDGIVTATISIPLDIDVKTHIELSFSVWDSIDRESIGMGGRSIEHSDTVDVRATVTAAIHALGTDDQEIEFLSCDIDLTRLEVELGEVDVFEPEDYWDGREEPVPSF